MNARVLRAERRGPGLIKREVMDARAQAEAIIAQAQQQAAALREQAAAQGREEGLTQAAAETAAQLLAIARARESELSQLEPQAVEVALLAARQLIGAELDARPERVAQMVAPLLQRVRRARHVTLRIHPDDRSEVERLLQRAGGASAVVEADSSLSRGDCLVHSDIGTLDARLDVRLSALARALQRR